MDDRKTASQWPFQKSRWEKFRETGPLLNDLFKQLTGRQAPGHPLGALLGDRGIETAYAYQATLDFGAGAVADASAALWLCVNAVELFKQVHNRLLIEDQTRVDQHELASNIILTLGMIGRDLPPVIERELLARLMVSIGVGMLDGGTDWSGILREIFALQFESPGRSHGTQPIMDWVLRTELDDVSLSLSERESSLRDFIRAHPECADLLNTWAYLLLSVGVFRPATPMSKVALEQRDLEHDQSNITAASDTYGWALYYEGQYQEAELHLKRALDGLEPFSTDWCEVQYHRWQTAWWNGNHDIAKGILHELLTNAPKNHWTAKTLELASKVPLQIASNTQQAKREFDYDVALSFAGEDRACAKELADLLSAQNVKVFYDDFEQHLLWGEDLYRYLTDIYQHRARYCVLFISESYVRKRWTTLECRAAQARAFQENQTYILPIRLDRTEVPGILPTTGYLSWHEEGAGLIANAILKKLG